MDSQVESAIDEVFSDTTVDQTTTWDRLQEIIEHCQNMQPTLDDAEQNQ